MEQKKKICNFIFSLAFFLMIAIPFCLLDTTPTITSELENRNMTEWPGLHFSSLYNEWYGHYAEDRIGFRNQAISFNNYVTYYVFGEFAETIHMKGKDGYVFPADEGYIQNYQRLNIDEELLDNLTRYLTNTSEYAKENGTAFITMVCPNKSSVYGQFMPDDIHVDMTKKSALDTLKQKLDASGVDYVIPDAEFRKKAEEEQIYNFKYDSAHWNDLGAFYGMTLLDGKIAETQPDIPLISRESFSLDYREENLELSSLPIKETIPILTYQGAPALSDGANRKDVSVLPGNNMAYFYNENASTDKTILILHDSFFDNKECYFYGRYREVYSCSRVNYTFMKEYIDVIKPDVIVFELAERSFADDLHAYSELGTYEYH